MLKIGLTGGIACGKSYALSRFGRLGAYTIDADQIARQVVEPGQPALEKIVREFGDTVLQSDGRLNRSRLGRIVFADKAKRESLNHIVHPYILAEEARRIERLEARDPATLRSPLVLVDAALMIEVGSYRRYDCLIVLYCHPAIQLQRLLLREGMTEEAAQQRIQSQISLFEKIKLADYIIDSSGKLSDTDRQVKHLYTELMIRYEEGAA